MFEDIGTKIKDRAKSSFYGSVLLGIIIGLVVFIAVGGFLGFIIGALIALVCGAIGYNSVIMLYAFGDMVENLNYIRKNTEMNFNASNRSTGASYGSASAPKVKKEKANDDSAQVTYPERTANMSNLERAAQEVNRASGQDWRCTGCDMRNEAGTQFCRGCGKSR